MTLLDNGKLAPILQGLRARLESARQRAVDQLAQHVAGRASCRPRASTGL